MNIQHFFGIRGPGLRLALPALFLCLILCGCQPKPYNDGMYGDQGYGFGGGSSEGAATAPETAGAASGQAQAASGSSPVVTASAGEGGIVIPARSKATWTARGNCMDPDRPAPRRGDKFQLVPASRLIDPELMPLYQGFMNLTAHDSEARQYQQQIVWAMRTVNKRRSYATSLGPRQLALLDKSYPGGAALFQDVRQSRVGSGGGVGDFLGGLLPRISLFGFTIDPDELLNPDRAPAVADSQLQHLVDANPSEPLRNTGYEHGTLAEGIATEIVGTAPLTLAVAITNNTDRDYVFVPSAWAAEPQRQVQRVSLAPPQNVQISKI